MVGGKSPQKKNITKCENYVKFKYQLINWHRAKPTHLHTIYGCFGTITSEMSSCHRNRGLQSPKYLLPDPSWKKCADLWLRWSGLRGTFLLGPEPLRHRAMFP